MIDSLVPSFIYNPENALLSTLWDGNANDKYLAVLADNMVALCRSNIVDVRPVLAKMVGNKQGKAGIEAFCENWKKRR